MALELQAIIHKEGVFDRDLISKSIQQELIFIYKKLYDIRMGFTYTHSTKHESRLTLPQIIYNDMHIYRNNIYYFLKKLINNKKDKLLQPESDIESILEKEILVDMQYLLMYYLTYTKSSSIIMRFLAFMLQPIQRIKEHFQEINLKREISKYFNITTKEESIERIKTINNKIELFVKDIYSIEKGFSLKNPIILLIYSAFTLQKQIFENKFNEFGLASYENTTKLTNSVCELLLKEKRRATVDVPDYTNDGYLITSSDELRKYFPSE